ncbi:MAG: sulfite exporter TauE/SafE family protein [Erysipelothrix sp.]|nr:sulfite exporter TauE/SafE family protein [Erysipelothrix sp.]
MNIDWIITLLTSITIFFASIVHGVAGFGLAQFGMGIMPFFRSVESAAIIFSMVATVSNFRIWWSVRDEFDFKEYIKPVIGLLVGMPMGIYIFNQLNEGQIKVAIGIILILGTILIILNKQTKILEKSFKDKKHKPNWFIPIAVGLSAGVLGGAVAIPGPPMILYGTFMAASGLWSNAKMKSIFTAFFGTLMLYRVLSVAVLGDITLSLAIEALITVPAMLLGSWIGIEIFKKISSKIFNWVVIVLLIINALILLIK